MCCPSCGHAFADVIDRKYIVTHLQRCHGCKLLFRTPTTSDAQLRKYYQAGYREGFTTELPTVEELAELKSKNFSNTEKDYSKYISVLDALGCKPGDLLLDFGCSWGYGSWQFLQAGYSVKAFEVSKNRCEFAECHLGVDVCVDLGDINQQFDIFFSAHVLEHIPKVSEVINLARKIVKPGGWFVAFTPNASLYYRSVNPKGWHSAWGFVHPIALDEEFYKHCFLDAPYLIDSSPYKLFEISNWVNKKSQPEVLWVDGGELLIAARL